MKKLLVLALAVVLTLSLAVVASAATFDPFVGGRVTWAYIDNDNTEDAPATYNNSGLKMLLEGKIKDDETGTWATIGAKIDGWPTADGTHEVSNIYDFGIKKIGGSNFNIWYTNWENENAKRGQDRIRDIAPAKFHADPVFDHAAGNVLGIDYISDNLVVNIGYAINKEMVNSNQAAIDASNKLLEKTPKAAEIAAELLEAAGTETAAKANQTIAAATFKFDGGDVHLGYWLAPAENTETNVGGQYKFGFGTIKADYLNASPKKGDSTSQIQAAVFFDALKFDVTVLSDDKYTFATDGGLGFQVRYTGLADGKVTLAYRALTANDKADEGNNLTDFYIGYKYGIFETRLGSATTGKGNNELDSVYAAVYASLW